MASPLTEKAEDWSECSTRLLLETPDFLRSGSDWTTSPAKLSSTQKKSELLDLCDQRGVNCPGKKADVLRALASSFLGPDVPEGGVRMCHPGIAMGYDTQLRNPAWCAYRLNPQEQRQTDNLRKSFELDPALKAASIEQTAPSSYRNTGFDKGHLAPSAAASFQRAELKKMDRSPWVASYFASNIAPQYDEMNQRCWKELEEALHKYAKSLPQSEPGVFVVTGVSYWNRESPRRWDGDGECFLQSPCGDACDCRVCGDTFVTMPTFYWKAVCDPAAGSSFAIIAENDPISSSLSGGRSGWPPSVFKTYSVDDLQKFFGLNLKFPSECHTDQAKNLIPDWNQDKGEPHIPSDTQHGNLSIGLIKLGGKRVKYKEQVWLSFETAFGPAGDFHDTFTLKPPPPKSDETTGWKADCDSLIAQQLPKLKLCSQEDEGEGIRFQFSEPFVKGGTFVFRLSMTAPAGELSHNQWTASIGGTELVARGEGFELLPGEHPPDSPASPDSPESPDSPVPNKPGEHSPFQYWPILLCAAAILLLFLCGFWFVTRRTCSRTARERELEVALERERATLRQANAELQRRSMHPAHPGGIEMSHMRQARF